LGILVSYAHAFFGRGRNSEFLSKDALKRPLFDGRFSGQLSIPAQNLFKKGRKTRELLFSAYQNPLF
jgi:hypothetical protein